MAHASLTWLLRFGGALCLLFGAGAAEAFPEMKLESLEVCGQQFRLLSQELAGQSAAGQGGKVEPPALRRIGHDLAYTPLVKRPASIACLRPQLRLGALLPDHSALVISTVPRRGAQDRVEHVPCAVLVGAPHALSAAALFSAVPTTFAPTQQLAYLSEASALELLDLWNVSALSGEAPLGPRVGLPPRTIYVTRFDSLRDSLAIYVSDGRMDLGQPLSELREHIVQGDLQLLGAFNRFASEDASSGERVLRWFAGFQDIASDGESAVAQLTSMDQRALAQELANALPQLSRLDLKPPSVALLRLRVARRGDGEMRYELTEQRLSSVAPSRPTGVSQESAARFTHGVRRLLFGASAVALLGLMWSLFRLGRHRRARLDAQARDPRVAPRELVLAVIARGDALLDALRFAAPLLPLAFLGAAALRIERWSFNALGTGVALALGIALSCLLAELDRRRRRSDVSSSPLARYYGPEARQHWQELVQLLAQNEQESSRRLTEQRLRKSLLESLSLFFIMRRLLRQPFWLAPILTGVLTSLLLVVLLRPTSVPIAAQASLGTDHAAPAIASGPPSSELLARCLSPDRDLMPAAKTSTARPAAPPQKSPPPAGPPAAKRPSGISVPALGQSSGPESTTAGGVTPPPPVIGARSGATSGAGAVHGYTHSVVPYLRSRKP